MGGLLIEKLVILTTLALLSYLALVRAICPDSYKKVTKDELIKLDREVSEFYKEQYDSLDRKNVTYEEQLFKTIRAGRHATVINYHDFKYTNLEAMRRAEGAKVNDALCVRQLGVLLNLARVSRLGSTNLPLSAIDFLESSGRVEPGALNGNTYWKGSEASCVRAKVPIEVSRHYLNESHHDHYASSPINHESDEKIITGRYCIAHLKAKSWPKWDKFFEDRISIKLGLCIPETCHSRIYIENADVNKEIDFFARHNLLQPFNNDRYEISYLYCLPDEDSQHREWNLSAKLFVSFVVVWFLITIYANYKYQQRAHLIRKLREVVDIRMIISQKRESSSNQRQLESDEEYEQNKRIIATKTNTISAGGLSESKGGQLNSTVRSATPENSTKSLHTLGLPAYGQAGSAASSLNPSPMPSEVEDNDGEFGAIRPLVVKRKQSLLKKKSSNPKSSNQEEASNTGGLDFIKAFSISSNLNYLFRRRKDESDARASSQDTVDQQVSADEGKQKQMANQVSQSQQFSASINKRASISNEALIKDLRQQEQDDEFEGSSYKVSIVSSHSSNDTRPQSDGHLNTSAASDAGKMKTTKTTKKNKRVDMDILDGVKVIATGWIIYGHTMMFFFGVVNDLRFADERMFDFTIITLLNTLQVVSMFYIITGALVTYLAFGRERRNEILKPSFWILAVLSRYLRLLPPYLLVFWFARNVATYTGSGATWSDYRTDDQHVRHYCSKEPWSIVLTMSAADIKIPLDCVPQTWYLSNDFRTLLIIPIYVIILAKNRTAGYVAILATFAWSAITLVRILRDAYIDYEVLLHWTPQVYSILADRLHDVYTNLSVRLSTYLLGVVVGHLLYLYDTQQIKKWPTWFTAIGLKLALLCASIFFMGAWVISNPTINRFLPAAEQVDSDLAVILIPIFKAAMEICMSVGILLLVTGSGYKWVRELLSSNIIKVLSNISYGVFLFHIELMYKVPLLEIESNYWILFIFTTFYIVFSNAVAFAIYLFYEMPINNVLRYVFQRAYKVFIVNGSYDNKKNVS